MTIVSKLSHEDHKKSTIAARLMYVLVFLTFVSLCAFAVTTTMSAESHKEGFQAITVTRPISFLDTTYLKKTPKTPAPVEHH